MSRNRLKNIARSVFKNVFCRDGVYLMRWGALKGAYFRFPSLDDITPDIVFGRWESNHFKFIKCLRTVGAIPQENAVVCDIGANIGLYSVWFDRLYKGKCIIYAFEPSPHVINLLSDTIALNKCTSVRIVPRAVADKKGVITFFVGTHHSTGSIHQPGVETSAVTVETIDLDGLFFDDSSHQLPHFIKIDIEGAGTLALPGARRLIREAEPIILMDSHNPNEDAAIGSMLKENNWSALRLDTGRWVENLDATAPVENGVWGTMALCPPAKRSRIQSILDKKLFSK